MRLWQRQSAVKEVEILQQQVWVGFCASIPIKTRRKEQFETILVVLIIIIIISVLLYTKIVSERTIVINDG